jgi:hypothetical protein
MIPLPGRTQVRIHNLCESHNLHPGLLGDESVSNNSSQLHPVVRD